LGIQLNFGERTPRAEQFIAIPKPMRADAQWARAQAKAIANTRPSANTYFRTLPAHRTLSALLADSSIWVSYYTGVPQGMHYTLGGFNEIGLGYWAFQRRPILLGVLIHELAHAGGAPESTRQAENALVHCGLGTLNELTTGVDDPTTPYDPTISG